MRALNFVAKAIDQVNEDNPEGARIASSPETPLVDNQNGIDSLALVNLVAAIEQVVFDETGKSIVVADESVFSSPSNPFRTVGSLAAHLETMLRA